MEDLKEILANTKTNSTHYVTVKDRTVSVRATADIQTIVDLKAENAELKAQQLKDDLLVMSNARRLIKAKNITSNGRLYMELFGTGMGTGRERCRTLGLDPDDNKTSFTLARSEGE